MSAPIELAASLREPGGKGAARAVRRQGRIPAVVYGGEAAPLAVALPYKEIDLRIHAGGFLSTVIALDVDGDTIRVIPRDFQLDPVRDSPLHVDFLRITADSVINVEIPVHFINEEASPGLKRGGVLNIVRHAVEVTCPAEQIPVEFVVDLTGLDLNDSIHISSIQLPDRVKPTITDRDFTIATIAAPAGFKEDSDEAAEGDDEATAGGESDSD